MNSLGHETQNDPHDLEADAVTLPAPAGVGAEPCLRCWRAGCWHCPKCEWYDPTDTSRVVRASPPLVSPFARLCWILWQAVETGAISVEQAEASLAFAVRNRWTMSIR